MRIFFFNNEGNSADIEALETRIRTRLPAVEIVSTLQAVGKATSKDRVIIIYPLLMGTARLDGLVDSLGQEHTQAFFIFVSKDISASDYKRLVRTGTADWVSWADAPQEITDLIARTSHTGKPGDAASSKLVVAGFFPSAGGVGNTMLALECAVQLKLAKRTRGRRICLLDLDLQSSLVCDYLDLEPRLQMPEIIGNPERLDDQLFELFVSHHSSGVDVIASARNRTDPAELTMPALDALFGMIAPRYDLLIVDLPSWWAHWTRQIAGVCELVVVTGINTVPGLRQVADTLGAIKSIEPRPRSVLVALNRCETRLFGGIARGQHVKKLLAAETVVTVREDSAAAVQSANTGIPMAVAARSSRISKDIAALAALVGAAGQPTHKG